MKATTTTKPSRNGRTRRRTTAEPSGNGHAGGRAAPSPLANGPNGQADAPPAGGRDAATGRFAKGNPGGPGNPHARRSAALRAALTGCVSEAEMRALGRRLYEMGLAGNLPAAELLLRYCIGKPQPAPDPDRLDVEEMAVALLAPRVEDVRASGRVSPAVVAALIRSGQAQDFEQFLAMVEKWIGQQKEKLREMRDGNLDLFLHTLDEAAALGIDDDDADE
jgi:hypothetical protein